MTQISITATGAELLLLSKAVRDSVIDKSSERRFTITLDNSPGANSTWAVTDPQSKVRRG